jgi:hypothetical protein
MGWRDFKLSCHTETADKPQSHYFIDRNNSPKLPDRKPEAKHPIAKGGCKSLEVVADAILEQAVIDIDYGGIWQSGPDIEILENEINRLHRLLMDGLSTLAAFKEIVNQWQATGTQMTKH